MGGSRAEWSFFRKVRRLKKASRSTSIDREFTQLVSGQFIKGFTAVIVNRLMWDFPMYAMHMSYYHKEAVLADGTAEYCRVGNSSRDRGGKKGEVGRRLVVV